MRISDWSSDVCSSDLEAGQEGTEEAKTDHLPERIAGKRHDAIAHEVDDAGPAECVADGQHGRYGDDGRIAETGESGVRIDDAEPNGGHQRAHRNHVVTPASQSKEDASANAERAYGRLVERPWRGGGG